MFLQVAKNMYDMNGTMTENANRLFSMPNRTGDRQPYRDEPARQICTQNQWLGSDAASWHNFSALLKYDF